MDAKFQTSFIPKKPITEEKGTSSSISLFLLLSIIVFLVALGLAGWVFLQKKMTIQKIEADKVTIDANKSSFETATIEAIIRLDSRIKVAKDLLSNHVSVSPVFAFLENKTLKSIRFKNFHFSGSGKNENGEPSIRVEMSGQAKDFKTIALQADELGKVEYRNIIKNPVFSDLSPTADGSVSFSAMFSVLPSLISYSQTLGNQ